MSEKMERRIKIGVAIFLVFIALLTVITLTGHSKYDDTAHQMEQGKRPVYVQPPDTSETNGNQGTSNSTDTTLDANADAGVIDPQPVEVNKFDYSGLPYSKMLERARKDDGAKVIVTGTIYSALTTGNGKIYSIADKDGNYYSVIDKTGSFEKFNKTQVISCWGRAVGVARLNSQDIPQIEVDLLELN